MAIDHLTIALERYDRHVPFFSGSVTPPDGVRLTMLEVGQSHPRRDGVDRNTRMIHDAEFDVCEVGLAPYIMAKARGMAVSAVPVFPRRLFSAGRMFVTRASGIETPGDLVGKRVAIHSFQVTLSVLAKGDLKFDYGVPWEKIHWFTTLDEKVAFTLKQGASVEALAKDADPGDLLARGELDAFFSPQPPKSVLDRADLLRPLFPDARAEEARYFEKHGYFPIMHILAVRPDLIDREPWLAAALVKMHDQAMGQCRDYYDDPNYSRFAWAPHGQGEEAARLSPDPWPSGLAANRANLECFIGYCHDQGLIDRPIPVESLFADAALDS